MSDGTTPEHRLREIIAALDAANTGAVSHDPERTTALVEAAHECLSEIQDGEQTSHLAAELAATRTRLEEAEQQFTRLRARRSVHAALSLVDRLSGVRALGGRATALLDQNRRSWRATRQRRLIARMRTNPRTDGPLVSIIIPSHEGRHFLGPLFDALEATTYASFEVIVVDNASTDDTQELIRRTRRYPLRTVVNARNETFSIACNQGIAAAHGRYILLLNNDVKPLHPSWLGAMVDRLEDETTVAVGALLVYQTIEVGAKALGVQHAGVRFGWLNGGPRPVNIQPGDATDSALCADVDVPAATAAALLTTRAALDAVGGLTEEFVYGWEDIDLCLKLREHGGRIVMCGDAALEHVEFGTQQTLTARTRADNFRTNSRLFWDRWLPHLAIELRKELFSGDKFSLQGGHQSVVMIASPASSDVDQDDAETAAHLAVAFGDLGWSAETVMTGNGRAPIAAAMEISFTPDYDARLSPEGAVRIAWIRNRLSEWLEVEWLEDFDLIFTSVEPMKTLLGRRCAVPVQILPSATDMKQSDHPAATHELGFVGSPWGSGRRVLDALDLGDDIGLSLWGDDWQRFPAAGRWWRGPIPESGAKELYAGTRILLDASRSPSDEAYSSRVLDALVQGALVITDDANLSDEWFDGQLPTYASRSDLASLISAYAGDNQITNHRRQGPRRHRCLSAHVLSPGTSAHRRRHRVQLSAGNNYSYQPALS